MPGQRWGPPHSPAHGPLPVVTLQPAQHQDRDVLSGASGVLQIPLNGHPTVGLWPASPAKASGQPRSPGSEQSLQRENETKQAEKDK